MKSHSAKTFEGPPARILVIDDEQRMANSVKTLLTNCGYAVEAAYSGNEGIQKLTANDYHLVITDLRMSDADGFDVIRAIGDRKNIGFILITGHASTESAIEALHHKVYDYITKPFEFDVLRASVETALARIEAERFRDDMISMITHDIKIPLSSIIGFSSLIFDKETGNLNPRAREFVQTINSNGLRILSLIDNFLTSCKIDAGRFTVYMRNVNISYMIEDLLSVFQVEFERLGLRFELDLEHGEQTIAGDEKLLFRAISNLFSNVCKFTPSSGTVTLRTRVLSEKQSCLRKRTLLIAVSNTGPGIPENELEELFEKYRRSSSHQGIEGSGIGLYVLKYIVEAHGGKVLLESRPDVLTTFSLFLPIEEVSQSPDTKESL